MPTVAIVSQKGGSGKTTLTLHLGAAAAYNGKTPCVIDTDPQATASAWGDWRGDFQPEIVTSPPARLEKTIAKLVDKGCGFVLIDTPPHGETASREAVRVADLVLIPARPRAFDLHALEGTADMIASMDTPAYVLFNGLPAGATQMLAEATEFAENAGLKVCPVQFGERAAFHRSSATGEVAQESDPEGKAAGEVDALWKWTCKQLGIKARK
ncbi:MAG: ParA family protein [Sphingomonadaceae bacterium]